MKAALIILDGWGVGRHDRRDAITDAATPNFDSYRRTGAFATLDATGPNVGLPPGGMGNSEVGHLTIGAGRVIKQANTRITDAIEDGSFGENAVLVDALDSDATVHFVGLVSDAGVHATDTHLHALIELAAANEVSAVTHAITDGRDTPPTVATEYIEDLERVIDHHGTGDVATVSGRYYAMDRDEHWDRTYRAYEAIVNGTADHHAPTATDAVANAYERGEADEFIVPTVIDEGHPISNGDIVICFNFRADRMRQLVRMIADIRPDWSFDTEPPSVRVVTMTEYDATFGLPVLFEAPVPVNTLGEVLAAHDFSQLRIAETEKYAHVTYFLNGGREIEFAGEIREIIQSPAVETYDLRPEMSAHAVTDTAIDRINSDDPDVLVLNYANPDMVGHTGDYEATITAVETVDTELGRLVEHVQATGAHVLIIADHGNADDMGTPSEPHTAHTFNPVPLIYLAPDGTDGGCTVRATGGLADIAPTLLDLLSIDIPPEMTGASLLE